MGSELTEKVLAYQKTGTGLDKIMEEISKKIYRYPFRKFGWQEDECSDFFLSMYARIPRMVEKYRDSGFTFEAYLYATLKWQMRTFIQKKKNDVIRQRILETQESENYDPLGSPDEGYDSVGENKILFTKHPPVLSKAMRKRIIFALLKNFYYVSDEQIGRTATMTCTPVQELYDRMETVRKRMVPRIERLTRLRERRNSIFFRIRCLEQDLYTGRIPLQSLEFARNQLSLEKNRLHDIQREISCCIICPSHKDIADVMDVPKGTVDSGLYYLRASTDSLLSLHDFMYA